MKFALFLFLMMTTCFVNLAQARIVTGYFKNNDVTFSDSNGDIFRYKTKVFIKEVVTKTPKGAESNYYGFITFLSKDLIINEEASLFWIEEIQPGHQIWYKIGLTGTEKNPKRSIERKENYTYEVQQVLENGDLKLKFSGASSFDASYDTGMSWADIPKKGIQLEKEDNDNQRYEGILTQNSFIGSMAAKSDGHLSISGSYLLKTFFTGAYVVIGQKPSTTARRGYEEDINPKGFFITIKDGGDYVVYFFDGKISEANYSSAVVAEED